MSSVLTVTKLWNGSDSNIKYNAKVSLSLAQATGDIIVHVDADYNNDPAPKQGPGRVVGLWEHEVFEIFISSGSREDYLEINVGPHGHYYLKMFTPYGSDDSIVLDAKPVFSMDKAKKRWSAVLTIPTMYLPEPDTDFDIETPLAVRWYANANAILGIDNTREYFSSYPLNINATSPDFHQPKLFQPIILTETEEARMTRMSSVSRDKSFFGLRVSTAQSFSAPAGNNMSGISNGVFGFGAASVESQLRETCIKLKSEFRLINTTALDKAYTMHFVQNEFAVLYGTAGKWKGLSYKKRMLVLTSKPRLLYFSVGKGNLKGVTPWGRNQQLTVKKRSNTKIDIELSDKSRTYYWTLLDTNHQSDQWMKAIALLDSIINKN